MLKSYLAGEENLYKFTDQAVCCLQEDGLPFLYRFPIPVPAVCVLGMMYVYIENCFSFIL